MENRKKKKLEGRGWKFGTAQELLGLTEAEAAYVEIKARLAVALARRRKLAALTQTELARRLGSSQSRVAKAEAADPNVSVDLLVRSLLAAGATRADVAKAVGTR